MSPNVHIQMQWPPVGIEAVSWDKRAMVMSAVLAGSYYSANVAMVAKDHKVGPITRPLSPYWPAGLPSLRSALQCSFDAHAPSPLQTVK